MKTIKGQSFLTITASAGETYMIDYTVPPKLSIANNTTGNIIIGTDSEFTDSTGAVRECIDVPSGVGVNNIRMPFNKVYIKTEDSGSIVIVRCG